MMEGFQFRWSDSESKYFVEEDSFIVAAHVVNRLPSGFMIQDFIHNGKKLINPLDQTSRSLLIGIKSIIIFSYNLNLLTTTS